MIKRIEQYYERQERPIRSWYYEVVGTAILPLQAYYGLRLLRYFLGVATASITVGELLVVTLLLALAWVLSGGLRGCRSTQDQIRADNSWLHMILLLLIPGAAVESTVRSALFFSGAPSRHELQEEVRR